MAHMHLCLREQTSGARSTAEPTSWGLLWVHAVGKRKHEWSRSCRLSVKSLYLEVKPKWATCRSTKLMGIRCSVGPICLEVLFTTSLFQTQSSAVTENGTVIERTHGQSYRHDLKCLTKIKIIKKIRKRNKPTLTFNVWCAVPASCC